MNVGVCRVFSQVFLLILLLTFLSWPICQNVYLEFRAFGQVKAVHRLSSDSCLFVARELDDRVTAILARVRIFGQLNRVDLTERLEKLADILLSQGGQGPNKPTNVDPIILLSLCVLVARRQRVSQRRNVILVRPTE